MIIKDLGGTIPVNSLFGLSVFQTGFNFSVVINSGQCSEYKSYVLPQFKGLTIAGIENTTCGTCADGSINVNIDNLAPCNSCVRGMVRIFNVNQLNIDLSAANTAKMLPKGDYYVVVEDANNGCYVAFERVFNVNRETEDVRKPWYISLHQGYWLFADDIVLIKHLQKMPFRKLS
ncbi:MAG: hypothetical protein IPG79_05500 [Saprospiraceae bacterium]|nr:hypothetical protein [Saprospiraceae bacterium]